MTTKELVTHSPVKFQKDNAEKKAKQDKFLLDLKATDVERANEFF